jgi:hypothetical protein
MTQDAAHSATPPVIQGRRATLTVQQACALIVTMEGCWPARLLACHHCHCSARKYCTGVLWVVGLSLNAEGTHHYLGSPSPPNPSLRPSTLHIPHGFVWCIPMICHSFHQDGFRLVASWLPLLIPYYLMSFPCLM